MSEVPLNVETGLEQATSNSAIAEWRRNYRFSIAGAFGYATACLALYSTGAYVGPIAKAFGWSRMQVTSGLTIAILSSAIFAIPMGMLVDRYGARRFAVPGVLVIATAFALLGTASGNVAQWYFLWALLGVASLPVHPTVWTTAIASRFDRSRGLALAVTLCGASLGTALFPLLAALLTRVLPWNAAIAVHAAIWAIIAFPIVYLFLPGADPDRGSNRAREVNRSSTTLLAGFRSSIYLRLIVVTIFLGASVMAFAISFVPILIDRGAGTMEAAGYASIVGGVAVIARLTSGLLVDRFNPLLVGAVTLLFPVVSALLLLSGNSTTTSILAALFLGMTLGAEIDVLAYLTAKYFGTRDFGALFGGQVAAVGLTSALGPLIVAGIFDRTGSHTLFFYFIVVAMLISSLCIASLPQTPRSK